MNSSNSFIIHRLAIEMDKVADAELKNKLSLSYNRFYFLLTIEQGGTQTQHALAVSMGFSDPAVSNMLIELLEDGYVSVVIDPDHKKRRLISLTPKGREMLSTAIEVLDQCFSSVALTAKINEDSYGVESQRLLDAMTIKRKERS
jgi:DNA-binding MarR family transcriptional regulator